MNERLQRKNTYLFMRHGESTYNNEKRYAGQTNCPLTPHGIEQTKTIDIGLIPTEVYSSTLSRARQTAELVSSTLGIAEIKRDCRVNEKSLGLGDGLLYCELADKYPNLWNKWETKPIHNIRSERFPYGESEIDVSNRLDDFLADMESEHTGRILLVVTHAGVMRAVQYLLGFSKEAIYTRSISNGEILKVERNT